MYTYRMILKLWESKCIPTEWFSNLENQNVYLQNDCQTLIIKMYTYRMIVQLWESKCIPTEWLSTFENQHVYQENDFPPSEDQNLL